MMQAANVPVSLDALLPENAGLFRREVARALGVKAAQVRDVRLLKRSIDARKKSQVHGVVTVAVKLAEGAQVTPARGVTVKPYDPPAPLEVPAAQLSPGEPRPLVVGTGPAGLFCALYLARAGLRPLVVERGAAVDERVATIEAFNTGAPLDAVTNIQFGEGGAGTFSDGKLNSGIKSPHIRHVLEAFVEAGAPDDILVDAKPHIGTDLLVDVVRNLRRAIEAAGGEVRFNTQLTGLVVEGEAGAPAADSRGVEEGAGSPSCDDAARAAENADVGADAATGAALRLVAAELTDTVTGAREVVPAACVVLACGHSARDTFAMVRDAGAVMDRKPFAVGVRIEHPQSWLNDVQYGPAAGHLALGAADYKLAVKCANGRGVYTFCMCPGGEVVAAASEEGGLCVNGMSRHARAGANANSALLVEVRPDDLPGDEVLEGVALQREIERAAYDLGSRSASEFGTSRRAKAMPSPISQERCSLVERQGHGPCPTEVSPVVGVPSDAESHCAPFRAPAQTVGDFLAGTSGTASPALEPTYPRGVAWRDLHECLPPFVTDAMAEAFPLLDRKLPGFADGEAVMTGVEARSSSPVRIRRDADFQSNIAGLYPCGEGAGYAGGIMSAAVDGLRVAEAIVSHHLANEPTGRVEGSAPTQPGECAVADSRGGEEVPS